MFDIENQNQFSEMETIAVSRSLCVKFCCPSLNECNHNKSYRNQNLHLRFKGLRRLYTVVVTTDILDIVHCLSQQHRIKAFNSIKICYSKLNMDICGAQPETIKDVQNFIFSSAKQNSKIVQIWRFFLNLLRHIPQGTCLLQ